MKQSVWSWLQHLGRAMITVAFAVVVLALLFHTVPALIGAEASYIVLSGSMEPGMSPGDLLFVYGVDPSTVRVGDVITYQRTSESVPVTHRVVEVQDGPPPQFLTKGDNNEDVDPGTVPGTALVGIVPAVDVPYLGEVLFVLPAIGRLVLALQTTVGFGLLIVAPMVLFVLLEVRDLYRRRHGSGGSDDTADSALPATLESETETAVDRVTPLHSTGEQTDTGTPRSDEITLTSGDLKLSLIVLAAFAAYAVFVAVEQQTPLAVAVAVAAAGSTLLLGYVHFGAFGRVGTTEDSATERESPPSVAPAGSPALPAVDRRKWR